MDIEKLKKLKPKKPLKVIEKDLNLDPKMRKKPEFDPEDLKIDYSNDRLNQNEIEIPVFKNRIIRPFYLKGKVARYEKESLGGGFYKFTILKGKIIPKPTDRRHPTELIDQKKGGKTEFWIGYDHEKEYYYLIESEETFKDRYKIIEDAVNSKFVMDSLDQFDTFVTTFFSDNYKANLEKQYTERTTKKVSYFNQILTELKDSFEMLKNYHELLNVMNDIDDDTFNHINESLKSWETLVKKNVDHIDLNLDLNWLITEIKDRSLFKPIEEFYATIETIFWKRGYFINPFKNNSYPNFLEVHYQRQLANSEHFESDETLKIQKQKILTDNMEAAKKKNAVIFIKSE